MRQKRNSKNNICRVVDSDRSVMYQVLRQNGTYPDASEIEKFREWRIKKDWEQYQLERSAFLASELSFFNSANLVFPNGKQGMEYFHNIGLTLCRYDFLRIEGLEPVGLVFDPSTGIVSGTPSIPGDYEIVIHARPKQWQKGDPKFERRFRIGINADPKSIWKDLPVPSDTPFNKPVADSLLLNGEKKIIAASKRGRSHAHEGKPRDDDFAASFDCETGWYILAVADGAGSARYSREGSKIACGTVNTLCREQILSKEPEFSGAIEKYAMTRSADDIKPVIEAIHSVLVTGGAVEAYKRISAEADKCANATLKDFSTTLLLVICRKFSFGWFIASFGVGDGAIAVYDRSSDSVRLLNEPDGGEFAGQTRFLTMESIFRDRPRIKMTVVPDFTALALMTDGVSDPYFETDAGLARKEKWDRLWDDILEAVDIESPSADTQLLGWLDFWSQGNHDDRTIALLC